MNLNAHHQPITQKPTNRSRAGESEKPPAPTPSTWRPHVAWACASALALTAFTFDRASEREMLTAERDGYKALSEDLMKDLRAVADLVRSKGGGRDRAGPESRLPMLPPRPLILD